MTECLILVVFDFLHSVELTQQYETTSDLNLPSEPNP